MNEAICIIGIDKSERIVIKPVEVSDDYPYIRVDNYYKVDEEMGPLPIYIRRITGPFERKLRDYISNNFKSE